MCIAALPQSGSFWLKWYEWWLKRRNLYMVVRPLQLCENWKGWCWKWWFMRVMNVVCFLLQILQYCTAKCMLESSFPLAFFSSSAQLLIWTSSKIPCVAKLRSVATLTIQKCFSQEYWYYNFSMKQAREKLLYPKVMICHWSRSKEFCSL